MNRKIYYLIGLSFLLVIILGASITYSKYKSDVTGEAQADIANWNITVNDCNVSKPDKDNTACFVENVDPDNGTITLLRNFGINDISYTNNGNDNVVNDKIAPGSSGSFKIRIKPNDTEVSIKYNLKAWLDNKDIAIKLYRSDPNSDNKIPLEEDGYSGLIEYSTDNINYEEVITIYVDWVSEVDDNGNLIDTELGTSAGSPVLNIPVQIEFEQYNG